MNTTRLVRAPALLDDDARDSVFLAGGITGCEPWQPRLASLLADTDLVVLDPRRENFDDDAAAQIAWEHAHLRRASAISFWFTNTSLQPIALYELGAWSMTTKPMFVGIEPGYARAVDVREQTRLARNDVVIVDDLTALARNIAAWARHGKQFRFAKRERRRGRGGSAIPAACSRRTR